MPPSWFFIGLLVFYIGVLVLFTLILVIGWRNGFFNRRKWRKDRDEIDQASTIFRRASREMDEAAVPYERGEQW